MQLHVQYTLMPNSYPNLPLTGLLQPSKVPPNVTNSICSAQLLDNALTCQCYIMTVKALIGEVRYSPCNLVHTSCSIKNDWIPAKGQTHLYRCYTCSPG